MRISPHTVLFYPHHDEPSFPQCVFITVVNQYMDSSPYWVEGKAVLQSVALSASFRGSEGREIGAGTLLKINLGKPGFKPFLVALSKHPAVVRASPKAVTWDLTKGQPVELLPMSCLRDATFSIV